MVILARDGGSSPEKLFEVRSLDYNKQLKKKKDHKKSLLNVKIIITKLKHEGSYNLDKLVKFPISGGILPEK